MIWEDEIKTPTAVGILRYGFTDIDGTTPGYSVTATVQLLDDLGNVIRQARIANLVQHLTTAERDGLIGMMERLRTLAETELLP